jgi:hypothetical protein
MTWPKFWSQCSKDYAASNTDDSAAAPAKNDASSKNTMQDTAAPKGQTAMQACSTKWSDMKSAKSVPEGLTWPKFWSQSSKDYAAANAGAAETASKKATPAAVDDDTGITLPEPEQASKLDPNKTTVAGKRELTPGQKAAIVRIRACGAEWQAKKKAGQLPAGAKWPQYWSDCNKRLKAQGQ